jgi:hypothetical protein
MTEPTQISLDRKHVAYRRDKEWEIAKKDDGGIYRTVEKWIGNRRSLFRKMTDHGIVPSRDAETALLQMPEQAGFRPDEPLHKKAS